MVQLVEAEVFVEAILNAWHAGRYGESISIAPRMDVCVTPAGKRNTGVVNHVSLKLVHWSIPFFFSFFLGALCSPYYL